MNARAPLTLRLSLRRSSRSPGVACAVACALLLAARAARADGAFPDSQSILAPPDRPHEILLATNFGLVSSEDDGQTWTWSCEQDANAFGSFYQLASAPMRRLYTVANAALAFTDNGSCTWSVSSGLAAGSVLLDAFPDPSNAQRVLAIVQEPDAPFLYTVVESSDGGATFGPVRYTAAAGDGITGVEIARSDPKVIYLTIAGAAPPGDAGAGFLRKIARSADGGQTWAVHDLTPVLGTGSIRLLAVDRAQPLRALLRVGGASERLAVTDDGGATVRTPLELPGGVMLSFVAMSSGTLLIGATVGTENVLFRSRDGAAAIWQRIDNTPSFRALSERGGVVYGAADNYNDPFAVGSSTDEGTTWKPLMHYADVQAIDTCVKAQCQDLCQTEVDLGVWSADVCAATPQPRPIVDAGAAKDAGPAMDAGADAPARDAGAATDAGPGGTPSSGGHCGSPGAPGAGIPAMLAAALWARRRRR
jgi:hypothetical protein